MDDDKQVKWMAECAEEDLTLYDYMMNKVPSEHRHKVMLGRFPGKARYHDLDMIPIFDEDYYLSKESSWNKTVEVVSAILRERYKEYFRYNVLKGDIIKFYNKPPEEATGWGDRYIYYDADKLIPIRHKHDESFLYESGFPVTYWFDVKSPMNHRNGCDCSVSKLHFGWRSEYYTELASNVKGKIKPSFKPGDKHYNNNVIWTAHLDINGRKQRFRIFSQLEDVVSLCNHFHWLASRTSTNIKDIYLHRRCPSKPGRDEIELHI